MRLLALVTSAVAAALLVSSTRRPPPHPAPGQPRPPVRTGSAVVAGIAGVVAMAVVTLSGRRLALALIVCGCLAGSGLLVRRSRLARVAERRQVLVVEVCEALVGELRAGQPLVRSLQHCVEVWPEFEPVVAAERLGADVPSALRRLGDRPGGRGLRAVAAAWQVSQGSGAGLATALSQVADTVREQQSTRQVVRGELSSAQATARLVALLPLASLGMSAGIGGRPWHFLLATPAGLACLGLGSLLAFLGLLWIDRIAAAVLHG